MSVRNDYDRKTAGLAGVRVEGVEYWDMRDVEPREWDHGDWHHAVMGVELTTDAGPVSVVCTNTFHPYGVEIFDEPLSKLVVRGDDGPGNWTVTDHPAWRSRTDQPILAAGTFWERLGFGPGRYSDGSIATPARTVEVPVALRLDFAAGRCGSSQATPPRRVRSSSPATRSWSCSRPRRCSASDSRRWPSDPRSVEGRRGLRVRLVIDRGSEVSGPAL